MLLSLLADLKGRRRFVPPLKSSAGSSKSSNCAGSSSSGHRNGTGAGSSNSGADSEAPRYTSEKKVCFNLFYSCSFVVTAASPRLIHL